MRYPGRTLAMLVGLAMLSITSLAGQERQETAEQWARENYHAALNRVLPSGFADDTGKGAEWIATIQILPTWDKEVAIRLVHTWQGKTEAEIVSAKGEPISIQLRQLKARSPGAKLDDLLPQLSIERRSINETACTSLVDSARALERARIAPIPPGLLMMDATSYQFWIQDAYGGQFYGSLTGPGALAPKQPHELITWVENFRSGCNLLPNASESGERKVEK